MDSLRFGIAISEDEGVVRLLVDAIGQALAVALRCPVETRPLDSYEQLREALVAGELELAWLPPFLADRAVRAELARPLAVPVRRGSLSYSSAVIVAPTSKIHRVEDLEGARGVWVHGPSVAGCLLPRAMLAAAGDFDRMFASHAFVESHHKVVETVLSGGADVGATYAHVDDLQGEARIHRAAWGAAEVRVLAVYGPIPMDMLVASTIVTPPLIAALRHELIENASSLSSRTLRALLNADELVMPQRQHLESLRTYARALKADDMCGPQSNSDVPPPPSSA